MKTNIKKLLLTICISVLGLYTQAQITLEHDYPLASQRLKLIHLQSSGDKYVYLDFPTIISTFPPVNPALKFYNLNHTLWKTIPLNTLDFSGDSVFSVQTSILYITDNLFDTDPLIEFLFTRAKMILINNGAFPKYQTYIYNENLNLLFTDSMAGPWFGAVEIPQTFLPVVNTSAGTKMILNGDYHGFPARVYGLPGVLTLTEEPGNEAMSYNSNANAVRVQPNPFNNFTTVEYDLPDDVTIAEMVFYDFKDNKIRSFKVDHTFNNIKLSGNDLPAGMYYFQLETGKDIIRGKKVVKIN